MKLLMVQKLYRFFIARWGEQSGRNLMEQSFEVFVPAKLIAGEGFARKAVDAVACLSAALSIPEYTAEIGESMCPGIIAGTMACRPLWMNPVTVTPKIVEKVLEATFLINKFRRELR